MLDINKMREKQASVKEGLEYDKVHDFDDLQMEEIRLGLTDGLDVSVYAKHEFDSEQMSEIRLGLADGLDVSVYAKPELSWKQMEEIRLGFTTLTKIRNIL